MNAPAPDCCPQHSCPVCGGCLFFPCKVTANGIHPPLGVGREVMVRGSAGQTLIHVVTEIYAGVDGRTYVRTVPVWAEDGSENVWSLEELQHRIQRFEENR